MGVNGVEGADRLNSPLGGQRPALARRSRTLVQAEEAGRGKGGQASLCPRYRKNSTRRMNFGKTARK
jgi:hypothetical protein